jgi:phosphatidylglycerophosphatase A
VIVFRPTLRFAVAHPAHWVAFGFGAGLSPWAPGTAGTLVAWLAAWLAGPALATPVALAVIAVLFALGVWVCDVTGRHLGIPDHGAMVWDEIVAFLVVLAIVPPTLAWQSAAFLLFRLFDIAKPPPIRWLEGRFKGGWGVMADDLLAAGYTLLVLAVMKRFFL